MKVDIINGRSSTFNYRKELRAMGFHFVRTPSISSRWQKDCFVSELNSIEVFCYKNGLEFSVYAEPMMRSSDYREVFFHHNKGILGGRYYQCAYCGWPFPKRAITVDHLIPVNKVIKGNTRRKYIRMLDKMGINNVNDYRNLVAACRRCNSRKQDRVGVWILRGRLGRHPAYWIVRLVVIILFAIVLVVNWKVVQLFILPMIARYF